MQQSKAHADLNLPWYRQFWPWFIIALPASAVIASFLTLWLAVNNPDTLVVSDDQYRDIKGELKAQGQTKGEQQKQADSDPGSN